jgi:hypothetical protein
MLARKPWTGGRLAGLGAFDAAGLVNTLNAPGVWLCDKAVQNDIPVCGSEGVTKYTPYAFSALVYGAGLFLVLKMVRRGR